MRTTTVLPTFNIDLTTVEIKLDAILKNNLEVINKLCEQEHFTWDNFMRPLEIFENTLEQFWAPISHLGKVMDSETLREVVENCEQKIALHHTTLLQNKKLFDAISSIDLSALPQEQKKSIELKLQDAKLNGVLLPEKEKTRFLELTAELEALSQQFVKNVLDVTDTFKKHITDVTLLDGIPDYAKDSARAAAEKEKLSGFIFTLSESDYLSIIEHANSRQLREEIYFAYVTRASEIGPHDKQYDNSNVMIETLKKRFELARLLGFNNYAQYSLAKKMAKTTDEVLEFLKDR